MIGKGKGGEGDRIVNSKCSDQVNFILHGIIVTLL